MTPTRSFKELPTTPDPPDPLLQKVLGRVFPGIHSGRRMFFPDPSEGRPQWSWQ